MNEKEFYQRWVVTGSPREIAEAGGALATTPGQIFIAGYQAAIRQTFADLLDKCWYSFAVTEDRNSENPKPGLTMSDHRVTGFKTWIAGAHNVDKIVVKVGNGQEAQYGVVDNDETVVITLRDGRFLSDMTQGMAEFCSSPLTPIDGSHVARFRQYEPQFIYIAFLACVAKQDWPIAEQAQHLLVLDQNLKSLDQSVEELVNAMSNHNLTLGENWPVDQRLFTMYSKGIQFN